MDVSYQSYNIVSKGHSESNGGKNGAREFSFRKTIVYSLSSVMMLLQTCSIFLNLYEHATAIIPLLFAANCIALASLLWIHFKGTHATGILFTLSVTLMIIGAFLFLAKGGPDGSSLFWFILFPPMLMISLGLRYGSILFGIYYLLLFLLLFTPLDAFLAQPVPPAVRIRFMLAMFGAFFFSWWAEYLRHKTYLMLAEAMSTLEHQALTDHLTQLANRRDFYNQLQRVMAGCRRTHAPYAVALLDIDRFKRVNDTYGHPTGDRALKHLAGELSKQLRGTDQLFRWGGEEFAVLMPECSLNQALRAAERLRRHVEATPCEGNGLCLPLTVSVGLYCGTETENPDLPLRTADIALYEAKKAGRNRVVHKCRGPAPIPEPMNA